MNKELEIFIQVFADELYRRYQIAESNVTPESILLAVVNGLHDTLEKLKSRDAGNGD